MSNLCNEKCPKTALGRHDKKKSITAGHSRSKGVFGSVLEENYGSYRFVELLGWNTFFFREERWFKLESLHAEEKSIYCKHSVNTKKRLFPSPGRRGLFIVSCSFLRDLCVLFVHHMCIGTNLNHSQKNSCSSMPYRQQEEEERRHDECNVWGHLSWLWVVEEKVERRG